MRSGLLVVVLAACSPPAARGPAWPAPRPREVDGGQSLAPRAAARAVAAAVEDEKPDRAADKPAAPSAAAASPASDKPAATPAAPASEEPVTTDEIVIEVEDKD
jgi:hypothetical protein